MYNRRMPSTPPNRFGRRGGRGLRPWLLLPKVVAVAFYLGALAAALVVCIGGASLSPADPRYRWTLETLGVLFRYLIVPALVMSLAFGVALLLQHPREFLRMRWLLAKLTSIAIVVPAGHLYLSSRLHMARQADAPGVMNRFTIGLLIVLLSSVLIALVGRHKPRLGQNWARSYPTPIPPQQEP